MSRIINLVGQRFGKLMVEEYIGPHPSGSLWQCTCDCGGESQVASNKLRRGQTKSCGCLVKKHGMHNTITYKSYDTAKQRCNNPKNDNFHNYGGRGIAMCGRWNNPKDGFVNFLSDMGERPSKRHFIERIDNDGDYEPLNCKWADLVEQCNNRRGNRHITYDGETKTLANWARKMNMIPETISARIGRGWSVEKAIETPVEYKNAKH